MQNPAAGDCLSDEFARFRPESQGLTAWTTITRKGTEANSRKFHISGELGRVFGSGRGLLKLQRISAITLVI